MKKALAMALGAMLVAGAVQASAASQIDFSGYMRPQVMANSNNGLGYDKDSKVTDSYIQNRLRLNMAFHATDEVSVYWRLHALNGARWGANKPEDTAATTKYAYGQVKQDWGTISVGKLKDDFGRVGLESLGWNVWGVDDDVTDGGVYSYGDKEYDGIHWANRYDSGFQMVVAGYRLDDAKAGVTYTLTDDLTNPFDGGAIKTKNTQSTDLIILQPSQHWDGGGAALTLTYLKARTDSGFPVGYYSSIANGTGGDPIEVPPYNEYSFSPSFSNTWGDFSLHAAAKMGWGEYESYTAGKVKAEGQTAYVDGDFNYGPGHVNLAAWWVSGDDGSGDKSKGLLDMGSTFAPLLVVHNAAEGQVSEGNAIAEANALSSKGFGAANSNHMAAMLSGGHSLSDDVTLNYAAAYLTLNKVAEGRKKDIGTEIDLGLQVQLLDNLEFRSTAGYLMAGKALADADNKKPEDAYSWYNTLYFRF
jgi:hypothetical protein